MSSERISLRDGQIKLYKRGNVWQCKVKVPGSTGHKIKSCHTTSQSEATATAINFYDDLYVHVKLGGKLKSLTFRQVFDEWRTHEKRTSIVDRVYAYAIPSFGSEPIDRITASRIAEFWKWRRSNFKKKPPMDVTLVREMTAIRAVFVFGAGSGYLKEVPDLDPLKFNRKSKRKDTFTQAEWRVITRNMREWVKDAETSGAATGRDRAIACEYFKC